MVLRPSVPLVLRSTGLPVFRSCGPLVLSFSGFAVQAMRALFLRCVIRKWAAGLRDSFYNKSCYRCVGKLGDGGFAESVQACLKSYE